MINKILEITQSDIEPGFVMPSDIEYDNRTAARAVLFDNDGKIALLHASTRGYYKLPGGGVEQGEDMRVALARELMEEVGAEAEVVGEIGRVEEWRVWENGNLHQISDAYLAQVVGDIGEPEFTEKELAAGFNVYWATTIDEAIKLVSATLDHENTEVRFMSLREKAILETAKGIT